MHLLVLIFSYANNDHLSFSFSDIKNKCGPPQTHTHTHTQTHTDMHTCTCTHIWACTHTHAHTHARTHTHTHTHTGTHGVTARATHRTQLHWHSLTHAREGSLRRGIFENKHRGGEYHHNDLLHPATPPTVSESALVGDSYTSRPSVRG